MRSCGSPAARAMVTCASVTSIWAAAARASSPVRIARLIASGSDSATLSCGDAGTPVRPGWGEPCSARSKKKIGIIESYTDDLRRMLRSCKGLRLRIRDTLLGRPCADEWLGQGVNRCLYIEGNASETRGRFARNVSPGEYDHSKELPIRQESAKPDHRPNGISLHEFRLGRDIRAAQRILDVEHIVGAARAILQK